MLQTKSWPFHGFEWLPVLDVGKFYLSEIFERLTALCNYSLYTQWSPESQPSISKFSVSGRTYPELLVKGKETLLNWHGIKENVVYFTQSELQFFL